MWTICEDTTQSLTDASVKRKVIVVRRSDTDPADDEPEETIMYSSFENWRDDQYCGDDRPLSEKDFSEMTAEEMELYFFYYGDSDDDE